MNRQLQNVQDMYPLSPMQQGMLFHSLYSQRSGSYVEQMSFSVRGFLSVSAFQQAWFRVIERNPVLRTSFAGEALAEPVQVVHRGVRVPFESQDWRALSQSERERRLDILQAEERLNGFDLSDPPLMRLKLIRTEEDRYEFIWTFHHALLDGWSVPLLLHEVFALYEAARAHQQSSPPLRRPYRDYIVWLRRQDVSKAEAYWRRTLSGFNAPTPLGVRNSITSVATVEGDCAVRELEVPEQVTNALRSLARQNDITLNTVIQGTWALLLARYSGHDDIVFGATVSGRPPELPGAESMIGLFINTLPVRVKIPGHQRVLDWLKGIQAEQVEMRQYEYSPLVTVQGWSEVPRGTPLFESIVVFENYPVAAATSSQVSGLEICGVRTADQTNYPIAVVASARPEIVLRIVFQTAQFDPRSIDMILGHFNNALSSIAADPHLRIKEVDILGANERQQLLCEWNDTSAVLPNCCAHELIEAQAKLHLEAVAVEFDDTSITYSELDRRSNQLANHLCKLGVGPEVLVGILAERSIEMVVGIVGILKAGGAYVPLDPAYPAERVAFMLRDSNVAILLTQQHLIDSLPEHEARIVLLDADCSPISDEPDTKPSTGVCPDNLAYVIYTSGSTGRPKGAMLRHRGLVNLAIAHERIFGSSPVHEDRLLQFAPFSFDASTWEVILALGTGRTLSIARREQMCSIDELSRVLRDRRITGVVLPPSALALLPAEDLPELRTVIAGGEVCSRKVAQRWAKGRRFLNAYGPTEISVCASMSLCDADDQSAPSIGRPIANTRAYVLDESLQPVPCMVAGELYIGGIGVGRGYLNRPELTAERFLPDAFAPEPGCRMYKSGDLVRRRHDGNMEFLGRIDHQVKLRGFRIELGEIESVLETVPGITAAVAIVDEYDGDKKLIAFVVASDSEPALDASLLRDRLRRSLPEYMIPAAFLFVDALPHLPNGKVDRKALPKVSGMARTSARPFVPPRDSVEADIVQIWEDVLNVHPIGVTDDFFELGGHSLLAVRVAAQVKQRIGKELALVELFQGPTVEHLATVLRQRDSAASTQTVVTLQEDRGGSRPPIFFIHPSGGSVHWYTQLARSLGTDQPFYGVQARGLHGEPDIHSRIEDMAAYYLKAIREVQPTGPYMIGSWSMGVIIAFEVAQQIRSAGERVSFLGLLDQGPHIPGKPPADQAEYLVDLFGKNVPISVEELRSFRPDDQIGEVLERAKAVHFVYPDITLAQFRQYVNVMKTHSDAWRHYQAQPYAGPITLFRAQEQSSDPPLIPDLGWGEFAKDIDIRYVPGDHLSMMREPHVSTLAKTIRECMDSVSSPHPLTRTVKVAS